MNVITIVIKVWRVVIANNLLGLRRIAVASREPAPQTDYNIENSHADKADVAKKPVTEAAVGSNTREDRPLTEDISDDVTPIPDEVAKRKKRRPNTREQE
ncbi:hypothetical protein J6590_075999 [Homalodisca vitripennis]|nr:hypothetical protein J6590_075999 [Homalodisca vitripennis]